LYKHLKLLIQILIKTKQQMKTIVNNFIFIVFAIMIFNSCSKKDDAISYDLTGNWKVIYFMENGNKITKSDKNTWLDMNNGDITANFAAPDSNGIVRVSGIKVTNHYSGGGTIEENGKMSFGPTFSTKINEPEWTKLFQISAAENFEVRNSQLLIYYNNKKNIIALERN